MERIRGLKVVLLVRPQSMNVMDATERRRLVSRTGQIVVLEEASSCLWRASQPSP
jgi:hypothetical protein